MLIDLTLDEVLVIRDALNGVSIEEEREKNLVNAREKMVDLLVEEFDKQTEEKKAKEPDETIPEWATYIIQHMKTSVERYATFVDGDLVGGYQIDEDDFTIIYDQSFWKIIERIRRN